MKLELEHRSQYDAFILENESHGEERVDIFHYELDNEESNSDDEGSEKEDDDKFWGEPIIDI